MAARYQQPEDNVLLSPIDVNLRTFPSHGVSSPDSLNSVSLLRPPSRALTASPSGRSSHRSRSPSPSLTSISSPVSIHGNYPHTPVTLSSPTLVASSPYGSAQSSPMIHSPASIRPGQQSPFISVRPPSEDGEDDGNGNDSIIRGWNLQATRGSPPPPGQFMHYAYDGNHSHALSLDVRALPPTGHSRMSESPSSSVSTHSNAPPWPEPRVSDTWPFIQKSIANHAGNELPQLTFTQETHRKHKHKHKRKKHNRGHRSTENSLVLQYPPYIGLATSPSSPQVPYNVVSYPPPPQIQPNANAYFAASPHHYPGLTQSRSHSPQPYANSQPSPAPPMSVEGRMDYQPVIPSRIDPTYERGADNACPCVSWK